VVSGDFKPVACKPLVAPIFAERSSSEQRAAVIEGLLHVFPVQRTDEKPLYPRTSRVLKK
jgi:hypothetical protein